MKENFDKKFKKGKLEKVSFFEQFENFIESSKTTKKSNVIKAYRTTLNKLKEFESLYKNKITFTSIDISFYDKFLSYLINKNQYLNNTAGNYIKHIKTFMNFCYQRKIHDNNEYKNFKVFKEESQSIYLTDAELKKIENLDLSFGDRLNNIKNVFLLQCYTGLRYSDLIKLTQEDIKNDFIIIRTVKTKDEINIPISPKARKLLDNLDGLNFKFVSNQKMNSYLTEIGIRAGIDEPFKNILYRGSERIEKILPKYEMLSTHTARRTFITLSLEKGMRPEVVMKITGHKDYKSFKRYVKLTDNVAKEEVTRAWI
ncbi:MAG: hypothetical protein EPN82_02315 [Bacteroidetes bacterium]|nr:MAG: hypothetical protein EPN82_02315 [Bacteroidota bacterium]